MADGRFPFLSFILGLISNLIACFQANLALLILRPDYSRRRPYIVYQLWRPSSLARLIISVVRPKCLFPFDKIVVPSTSLLYPAFQATIAKRAVAWVVSVQPECTIPMGAWNFRSFKAEFWLESAPGFCVFPTVTDNDHSKQAFQKADQ